MNNRNFRWRAFISFFMALTFLLSAMSGIVLFLRPEGSLASWTGWSALGLDKKEWEGMHATAIFFFSLCAAAHLAYNWRALLAFCRRCKEPGRGTGVFRELVVAVLLTGLILAGTLAKRLPVRWILDLRAWFKSGAAVVEIAPPAVNSEKLTLADLCPLLGVSEDEILSLARRNGVRADHAGQTLAEVAELNTMSPEEVYLRLRGEKE